MNKINGIVIALLIILITLVGYIAFKPKYDIKLDENDLKQNYNQSQNTPEKIEKIKGEVSKQDTKIPSDWKTYINEKYGFSFQYPSTWSQWGKESESVCDLKTGATCVFNIDFIDTSSQGVETHDGGNNEIYSPKDRLHIEYHFDSKGVQLYQYNLSQYGLNLNLYKYRKISVLGKTALVTDNDTGSKDGKGNIAIPKHITYLNFLNKNETGSFSFMFTTPKANKSTELPIFEKILTTFKF